MAIWFWLKRPRRSVSRLRYWVWERMNPDKPWMCPGTVAFCQANLSRSMTAIEFGSGRSTRWFSTLVGHLTSVEHNPEWYEQVKQQLDNANVHQRVVPTSVAEPSRIRARAGRVLIHAGVRGSGQRHPRQEPRFRCCRWALPNPLRAALGTEDGTGRVLAGGRR